MCISYFGHMVHWVFTPFDDISCQREFIFFFFFFFFFWGGGGGDRGEVIITFSDRSSLFYFQPLLSLKANTEKAMLAVSSLVHSVCRNNFECENSLPVRKIIAVLDTKIGNCKVSKANFNTVCITHIYAISFLRGP